MPENCAQIEKQEEKVELESFLFSARTCFTLCFPLTFLHHFPPRKDTKAKTLVDKKYVSRGLCLGFTSLTYLTDERDIRFFIKFPEKGYSYTFIVRVTFYLRVHTWVVFVLVHLSGTTNFHKTSFFVVFIICQMILFPVTIYSLAHITRTLFPMAFCRKRFYLSRSCYFHGLSRLIGKMKTQEGNPFISQSVKRK